MKLTKKAQKEPGSNLKKLFLANFPSHSRFAESYRTLRTNIHFSFVEGDFRSILVTSAGEQEGKTTTVTNLAFTIARTGKSVLVIDADLRKPSLSNIVNIERSPGLTGLLSHTFGTEVSSGSLAEFGFSDLFWLLSFQKKTGRLCLTEGKEAVDVYFLEGEPVDVSWRSRPEEKKLAFVLIKNEVITRDQAKQALTRARISGQKLGFILVSMGAIKAEELEGYISLHAIEGLRTALQFKSGDFTFKKFPPSQYELPSLGNPDVRRLYTQMVSGQENLPYVEKNIQACIAKTDQANLHILPSGPRPPNPGELMHSARMSFLLSHLNRRFDNIIIDTPPILPASDAVLLAPQVDGVLMVVKAGHINRKMIGKAVDQIRNAQANVIGVVLNQVDTKKESYYKYYHKYYSKYYGEQS
ncbi:MAG: polysaccharide biosynthesis tyrosine autokinase [Deltaproteobacteria bacterium]|nr:polysaccharide biosynthesis tyrosine autokinase [Deltaproteobacteria bacterium]MBW1895858.1 polysaccharide biosynthesis tyrosine autokinase [Deltaproteobacteria bacterium]